MESKYGNAGAKYGMGYCDAQCPHDLKFINGEANVEGWKPSETDVNAGTGKYGSCCTEIDIWEANKHSSAFTMHSCEVGSQTRCDELIVATMHLVSDSRASATRMVATCSPIVLV